MYTVDGFVEQYYTLGIRTNKSIIDELISRFLIFWLSGFHEMSHLIWCSNTSSSFLLKPYRHIPMDRAFPVLDIDVKILSMWMQYCTLSSPIYIERFTRNSFWNTAMEFPCTETDTHAAFAFTFSFSFSLVWVGGCSSNISWKTSSTKWDTKTKCWCFPSPVESE